MSSSPSSKRKRSSSSGGADVDGDDDVADNSVVVPNKKTCMQPPCTVTAATTATATTTASAAAVRIAEAPSPSPPSSSPLPSILEEDGRVFASECMRGITMSRTSFTLFCGYHLGVADSIEKVSRLNNIQGIHVTGLDFLQTNNNNNNNTQFSNILQDSYQEIIAARKKKDDDVDDVDVEHVVLLEEEKKLTHLLASKLRDLNLFTVKDEVRDGYYTRDEGNVDLLLSNRKSSTEEDEEPQKQGCRRESAATTTATTTTTTTSEQQQQQQQSEGSSCIPLPLLGLVEVGLLSQSQSEKYVEEYLEHLFWKKMGLAATYLQLMQHSKKEQWPSCNGPLLLCILVATRNCDKGRLAIFVCEPRKPRVTRHRTGTGWSMALMWRDQREGLEQLSKAFGYYMNGLSYLFRKGESLLAKNHHQHRENKETVVWKYLGPDCTKVVMGNGELFVLRLYDDRFRRIYKTPYVYKNEATLRKTTQQILCIPDDTDATATNTLGDNDAEYEEEDDDDDWSTMLFRKWNNSNNNNTKPSEGGKVEVIAVPYVKGSHVCKNAKQALSLVQKLQDIHKQGFVHGDIRGFNIIFDRDGVTAHLIDWDFGGRAVVDVVDTIENNNSNNMVSVDRPPRYPPCYECCLPDGHRVGSAGQVIEFRDDVRALAYLLGYLHVTVKGPWYCFWTNWWSPILRMDLQDATTLEEMARIFKAMGNTRFIPSDAYERCFG